MKASENDKWLDDALGKVIGSEKSEPDFEKWKQSHPEAVEMLASRAGRQTSAPKRPHDIRSIIMKRPIIKLATAAAIIVIVVLSITFLEKSTSTATAAEFLTEAIKVVSNLHSIHIKARIRDLPQDNFQHIKLEHDFVPFEMWKSIDDTGVLRWRIEKPLRVAVMDGEYATMLIRNMFAFSGRCPDFQCYDLNWCGQLMNVEGLIESVLLQTQQRKDAELLMYHQIINGKDTLIVESDFLAQGDYTNDYLKNKFISASGHTRIYYFDPKTRLLEGFEIIVHTHTDTKDVLAFEITDIEYNVDIDPSVFTLELPDDVVWDKEMEILPDNEKYAQMTPKKAATVFFQACADEDWEEFLKFWPMSTVPQELKKFLGGLEIISIGEPFKSGNYGGWFVPYEIKLKEGYIKKHNLAVRNDNKAKRWEVDGGI